MLGEGPAQGGKQGCDRKASGARDMRLVPGVRRSADRLREEWTRVCRAGMSPRCCPPDLDRGMPPPVTPHGNRAVPPRSGPAAPFVPRTRDRARPRAPGTSLGGPRRAVRSARRRSGRAAGSAGPGTAGPATCTAGLQDTGPDCQPHGGARQEREASQGSGFRGVGGGHFPALSLCPFLTFYFEMILNLEKSYHVPPPVCPPPGSPTLGPRRSTAWSSPREVTVASW